MFIDAEDMGGILRIPGRTRKANSNTTSVRPSSEIINSHAAHSDLAYLHQVPEEI